MVKDRRVSTLRNYRKGLFLLFVRIRNFGAVQKLGQCKGLVDVAFVYTVSFLLLWAHSLLFLWVLSSLLKQLFRRHKRQSNGHEFKLCGVRSV